VPCRSGHASRGEREGAEKIGTGIAGPHLLQAGDIVLRPLVLSGRLVAHRFKGLLVVKDEVSIMVRNTSIALLILMCLPAIAETRSPVLPSLPPAVQKEIGEIRNDCPGDEKNTSGAMRGCRHSPYPAHKRFLLINLTSAVED
jgi:hypothetical protein